jgi:hypothetical protein
MSEELSIMRDGEVVGKMTFIQGFADYEFFVPIGDTEKKYGGRTAAVLSLSLDEDQIRYLEGCSVRQPDHIADAAKKVCEWKLDDCEEFWETSCDNTHVFLEGTPSENKHKFCPYCQLEIKEVE